MFCWFLGKKWNNRNEPKLETYWCMLPLMFSARSAIQAFSSNCALSLTDRASRQLRRSISSGPHKILWSDWEHHGVEWLLGWTCPCSHCSKMLWPMAAEGSGRMRTGCSGFRDKDLAVASLVSHLRLINLRSKHCWKAWKYLEMEGNWEFCMAYHSPSSTWFLIASLDHGRDRLTRTLRFSDSKFGVKFWIDWMNPISGMSLWMESWEGNMQKVEVEGYATIFIVKIDPPGLSWWKRAESLCKRRGWCETKMVIWWRFGPNPSQLEFCFPATGQLSRAGLILVQRSLNLSPIYVYLNMGLASLHCHQVFLSSSMLPVSLSLI